MVYGTIMNHTHVVIEVVHSDPCVILITDDVDRAMECSKEVAKRGEYQYIEDGYYEGKNDCFCVVKTYDKATIT